MAGLDWRQKRLVDRAPWLQPVIPDANTINGLGRPMAMRPVNGQFHAVPSDPPDNLTPIFSTAFANVDVGRFVCSDEEGNVRVLDSRDGREFAYFRHPDSIFDTQFSHDDTQILLASADEHTYVRDLSRFDQSLYCLGHHQGSVKTARYRPSSGSAVVATGSRDGDICLWDLRTCSPNASLNYPVNVLSNCHRKMGANSSAGSRRSSAVGTTRSGVVALEFLPFQDHLLASIGQPDHSVRIWDIRYKWGINALPTPAETIQSPSSLKSSRERAFTTLCVDPNGSTIYGLNSDNVIYGYSTASFSSNAISCFTCDAMQAGSYFIRMAVSPDGRYLACGSMEDAAFVFDTLQPGCAYRVGGHFREVTAVSWRNALNGPYGLLCAGEDGIIHCWEEGVEEPLQGIAPPTLVAIENNDVCVKRLHRPLYCGDVSSSIEFDEWPRRDLDRPVPRLKDEKENIPPPSIANDIPTPKASLADYFKPVPRSSPFASLAPSLPSSLSSSPRPLHGSKKRPPSLLDFLTKSNNVANSANVVSTATVTATPSKLSKHSHLPPPPSSSS